MKFLFYPRSHFLLDQCIRKKYNNLTRQQSICLIYWSTKFITYINRILSYLIVLWCTVHTLYRISMCLTKMCIVCLVKVQGPTHCTADHRIYNEDRALEPLDRGPYFDISASRNVTALVGKTATLNCRVRNLGDRTVCKLCILLYLYEY